MLFTNTRKTREVTILGLNVNLLTCTKHVINVKKRVNYAQNTCNLRLEQLDVNARVNIKVNGIQVWIPHRKQHTRRTVFNHRPHLSSYMQKRQMDGRERREAEEELEVQEEKITK